MKFPDDLLAGDILLYSEPGIVDAVIEVKTADDVAHVEIYHGNGLSVASRNGIGVNAYDMRTNGLMYVRRPLGKFERHLADAWFYAKAKGLPYGFAGLLNFVNVEIPSKGLICSTFADLYLRAGGAFMFSADFPPGKASPRDFKLTGEARTIWANGADVTEASPDTTPDGGESHAV